MDFEVIRLIISLGFNFNRVEVDFADCFTIRHIISLDTTRICSILSGDT